MTAPRKVALRSSAAALELGQPAEPAPQPLALPISKFSRAFGIGEATVYRHLRNGLLKFKVVGKRRLVLIPPTHEGPIKLRPGPRKKAAPVVQREAVE
jgi:hypothetical protein